MPENRFKDSLGMLFNELLHVLNVSMIKLSLLFINNKEKKVL